MGITVLYFDLDHAIREHDWIIENSGGLPGTNSIGQLSSVLDHVQKAIQLGLGCVFS